MRHDRREFLSASLGAVLLAQSAGRAAAAAGVTTTLEGGDLSSRMSWLNEPKDPAYSGGIVTARVRGKTDFWRKTYYGYVTDTGHFFYLPVLGEFTFGARIDGNYSALYDQAGLMVRLDAKRWMKCGTEIVDRKRFASVVFTHDYSDWSTMDDVTQTGPVYWRVARKKDSIEAQVSKDGDQYFTVRQGYFPADVQVSVGVMCASPEGAGFDVTFDQLQLEKR